MDPNMTPENRPVVRRRRKRSKLQTFKEAYLPAVLAAGVIVLIIVFISSSIGNSNKKKQDAMHPAFLVNH